MPHVCLALLLSLVCAPAAAAQSYSVPAPVAETELRQSADSVALAAGRVLWVEQRGTSETLVAAGADGVAHDVLTLPPAVGAPRFSGVLAAGDTAFFDRMVCRNEYCVHPPADELVRIDLTADAATPFGAVGCNRGRFYAATLRGTVLTGSGRCGNQTAVSDLADGTTRYFDGRVLDAVGAFAVLETAAGMTRLEWRTGRRIDDVPSVSLDPGADTVSLDADGTVAWAQDGTMHVLAIGEQQPRRIPLKQDGGITGVKLAGGRLAYRHDDALGRVTFTVSARDGSGVRHAEATHGPFGSTFDGGRLAWVDQPCALPVVQVWDLAAEPPAPPTDHCIRARIASKALRLNRARSRFSVELSCPPAPARGCAGEIGSDV